ncbi:predicted protein [Sclerotinia sclerotiorum 1980 UF-70]|uniref:Uncharacterized protein n=1 Tax=Sclerotinia sclerotiorum (strain ATCC 18683 / 1980 / Ss-1) TaxID=665079 RepID=A7E9R7_SCLS1|nr:predicted protein [Sclerotinia sclerotiorum 1980 UF-70]EDN97119.1 predicted protein [Sclerotinia sclerotiorum 1980 UF-70]
MLFFNPNKIMRTMIALLSVLFLTISIANAAPVPDNEVSTINASDGALCSSSRVGYCTLAVTVRTEAIKDGLQDYVRVFDSICNEIGGDWQNFDIDLASQLRFKIIGTFASGPHDSPERLEPMPCFCYGSKFVNSDATNEDVR